LGQLRLGLLGLAPGVLDLLGDLVGQLVFLLPRFALGGGSQGERQRRDDHRRQDHFAAFFSAQATLTVSGPPSFVMASEARSVRLPPWGTSTAYDTSS